MRLVFGLPWKPEPWLCVTKLQISVGIRHIIVNADMYVITKKNVTIEYSK